MTVVYKILNYLIKIEKFFEFTTYKKDFKINYLYLAARYIILMNINWKSQSEVMKTNI